VAYTMLRLSIVLPTFNERDNIGILFNEIRSKVKVDSYEILVVDDNSPDGTWVEALEYIDESDVVVRRINMKGLSSTIIDGTLFSLGRYVVVMDADLQHPPEVINTMFEKLREDDYDVVIGSRYVPGGGVEGWSRTRLVISKGATLIAKLLLPYARKVSDPMSGFFMVKKDLIVMNRGRLNPLGFKILLEILERCGPSKVVEVPYTFRSRLYGKSKLKTSTILEFVIHVLKLSRWRPFKFIIVGLSGVIVNLGTLWLISTLYPLFTNTLFVIGSAIAIEISILWNFILHEIWTFSDRRVGSFVKRLAMFHLAVSPGVVAQYFVAVLTRYGLYLNPLIAQLIGIAVGFPVNYVISELGVWKTYSRT
jgi:dolichol-phosphate mannosyltransferase